MSYCVVTFGVFAAETNALPPLGLIQIDVGTGPFNSLSRVGVFNDTAYVSTHEGIWAISASGNPELITISHPDLDAGLSRVTRVVQAPKGDLYFAATFLRVPNLFQDPTGAALYRLDSPTQPLVTWHSVVDGEYTASIAGIDASLRAAGTLVPRFDGPPPLPAEFDLDGTFEPLELDAPHPGETLVGYVSSISESGFAVGEASPSGTIGLVGTIWSPEGELTYLKGPNGSDADKGFSIRDRNDGAGINIGMGIPGELRYGSSPAILVHAQSSDINQFLTDVVVSQSDFAAVNSNLAGIGAFFYYPGLVPDDPLAILPIADVFPELASIDVDMITDLDATPDGHIFMTLSGPDGLYLFGARDPSVIPEPATWTLLIMSLVAAGGMALRGRGR